MGTAGIGREHDNSDRADKRIVWISTRKFLDVADVLPDDRLLSRHLLHDVLHLKSTLPELSQAWLVAAELPANVEGGFEQTAMAFAAKALKQCPRLVLIVQPSLRRHSNRSVWMSRWNRHCGQTPFGFSKTCSCRVGDGVPGCHVTTYVGTTEDLQLEACSAVPSTDITVQSAASSLAGLLMFVISRSGYCNPAIYIRTAASEGIGEGDISSRWRSGVLQQAADSNYTNCVDSDQHQLKQDQKTRVEDHSEDRSKGLSFPTDAKERERDQRRTDKEQGKERVVRKKKKVCEEHYDDCGDDISSLEERCTLFTVFPSEYDTEEEQYYEMMNVFFPKSQKEIDPSTVARPERVVWGLPPDSNTPNRRDTMRPGCRSCRPRTDWTHSREVGQCRYP